jgi:hypothetical protein
MEFDQRLRKADTQCLRNSENKQKHLCIKPGVYSPNVATEHEGNRNLGTGGSPVILATQEAEVRKIMVQS